MVAESKDHTNTYNSPLRAEQRERTHERILEAAAEQLRDDGIEKLSLPRVARRACISVPTAYRHFPTEEVLMRELTEWLDKCMKLTEVPENVDNFPEWLPRLFAHWDENESHIRARLLSGASRQVHREIGHRRDQAIAKAMEDLTAELNPLDARRACALVRLLVSGAAWETMRDSWHVPGEQAGEALAWAINILVTELRSNPKSIQEFTGRSSIEKEV